MTTEFALWLAIGAGVLAIIYGIFSAQWIVKQPAGTERMQEIALAIQEGAAAYMNRQYTTIGIVGVVLFLVLGWRWTGIAPSASPLAQFSARWPATSACSFPCVPTCAPPRRRKRASTRR